MVAVKPYHDVITTARSMESGPIVTVIVVVEGKDMTATGGVAVVVVA